jgi:hypothetical protein
MVILDLVGKDSMKISKDLTAKYNANIDELDRGFTHYLPFCEHRNKLYDEVEHPAKAMYTAETIPSLWNRTVILMPNGKSVK